MQAEAVLTPAETHTHASSSQTETQTTSHRGEEGLGDPGNQHDLGPTHLRHSTTPQRHHRRLARLASVNQHRDQPHYLGTDSVELRHLDLLADQSLNWSSRVWEVKEIVQHGPLTDTEHPESSGSSTKTLIQQILEDPTYLARRMTLLASRGDFYSAITLMVTARMHDDKTFALSQ